MSWQIVVNILLAIIAVVIISTLIQPLLIVLMPPLGAICVIVLYIGVLAWLFGYAKWN